MTAVLFKSKFIPWIIGLILVAYALILGLGNGYEFSLDNILSRVDCAILGEDHMYHEEAFGQKLALDPEGILSTLPCIAHVLIGFMMGKCINTVHNNRDRIVEIAVWGALMLLVGWLLQYGIPCSKKAWTSSYVLITCGMASCILAMLIYAIDIKGHNRWCRFFQAFGINPLFCYLVGTVLAIAFGAVRFGTNASGDPITAHSLIYDAWSAVTTTPEAASCLYAITFVLITWCFGYILYKKKIYIKI